jgi:hypothetical protein
MNQASTTSVQSDSIPDDCSVGYLLVAPLIAIAAPLSMGIAAECLS